MIIEILRHTPGWVWLLLAALLLLGASQLRTRRVPRARLFVLPAVLLGLGLSAAATAFQRRHRRSPRGRWPWPRA